MSNNQSIAREILLKYAKWDADDQSVSAYETLAGFCLSRCLERGAYTSEQMQSCVTICTDDLTTLVQES
jgi:hypothetical protein